MSEYTDSKFNVFTFNIIMEIRKLNSVTPFRFRVWPKNRALPYIDARDCMKILDEKVWPENRQKLHKEDNWVIYCWVWIFINEQWVWKWDIWEKTKIAANKWGISDSFKRACVCRWIGRFLYTLPIMYWEKDWKGDITSRVRKKYKDLLMWWYQDHKVDEEEIHETEYTWQDEEVESDIKKWIEQTNNVDPLLLEAIERDLKECKTIEEIQKLKKDEQPTDPTILSLFEKYEKTYIQD